MTKKTKAKDDVVVFEKSTVLNKADREDFVDSAMADVPRTNYQEILESEARKDLENQLPAEIKKMMKTPLADYLDMGSAQLCTYSESSALRYCSIRTVAHKLKFTEAFNARRTELIQLYHQQIKTHDELRSNLTAIAGICKTDKALAERLPEFSKYIPRKGGSTANVPALANLVADFTKAGWPKSKDKK